MGDGASKRGALAVMSFLWSVVLTLLFCDLYVAWLLRRWAWEGEIHVVKTALNSEPRDRAVAPMTEHSAFSGRPLHFWAYSLKLVQLKISQNDCETQRREKYEDYHPQMLSAFILRLLRYTHGIHRFQYGRHRLADDSIPSCAQNCFSPRLFWQSLLWVLPTRGEA